MEIGAVIDLLHGRAVHAKGGARDRYEPVARVAGMRVDGDPDTLARVYVERLGARTLYLADLDAIGGAPPDVSAIRRVASIAPTWVDAGVTSAADALHVQNAGASRVVVGLETLVSLAALRDIVDALDAGRVVFSLDLRHGQPVTRTAMAGMSIEDLVRHAAAAGASAIVALDVGRVGSSAGPDLVMLRRVASAAPGVELWCGGGVRDERDFEALAAAGVHGALVATALHDGRLRGHANATR